jgi:hypothetical protein
MRVLPGEKEGHVSHSSLRPIMVCLVVFLWKPKVLVEALSRHINLAS